MSASPTGLVPGQPWNVPEPSPARVRVTAGSSVRASVDDAISEVAARLDPAADLILLFLPARYDVREAERELTRWAGTSVIGCTSAGGIGPDGYDPEALVAVALSGGGLRTWTVPIRPLSDLDRALADVDAELARALREIGGRPAFGILLADGLSLREEALADGLMTRLGDLPLIGGSAADDLRFEHTSVLTAGRFVPGTATLTLVATSAPWRRFRVQHHDAGPGMAVVTAADPDQRLVHTLNGRPAVTEYASLVGVREDELTPTIFSTHPLVLRAGGGEWVRSISRLEPDRSLRFLCAAELGTVLRLGRSRDPVGVLSEALDAVGRELGGIGGALVFDCILRRLEFQETGVDDEIGRLLSRYGAAGFSTYGEQYDGVHVNQTMVGIAFGE